LSKVLYVGEDRELGDHSWRLLRRGEIDGADPAPDRSGCDRTSAFTEAMP
jgi:hypothetical protein